ncbi:unnamed protein product [Trichobilharzia szidati]|nr:unnamed protein product [Trichobilharzia szidati]
MPMRIPQPIQIWFNSLHHRRRLKTQDAFISLTDICDEKMIDNNPLLIGGLENLLLEMIPNSWKQPMVKDGAKQVAQWIFENLIMLYDDNNDYCDVTERPHDHRNVLDDAKLVTIELLPTIIYVYFCLLIFTGPFESYTNKLSNSKSEIKSGNKVFNIDKMHSLKQHEEEENCQVTKSQSSNQSVNVNKPATPKKSQLYPKFIHSSNGDLSPKLDHKIKFSNVHKILIHKAKNEYQHIQHQSRKQQNEQYTNDKIDLINIFEVYLHTIYHICQRNNNNSSRLFLIEENLRDNFETTILSNPSIYGDALLPKNTNNKPDSLFPSQYLPRSPNHHIESKISNGYEEVSGRKKKQNENALNSRNRMQVLTTLMKEYNAHSLLGQSMQSKLSLCKLACLFNPFRDAQTDKVVSPVHHHNLTEDEIHSDEVGSPKREANKVSETKDGSIPEQTISDQSSPAKSVTFQEHKHPTDQESYGSLKNRAKIKANRITGLSTNFITEILFALYPVLFTQQSNVAYEAVKSIEVRATYELWTNVLLLVDSMKQDYERSKLPASKSFKHYNQVVNEQEETSKSIFNEMPNDENKLDSEQLCLASAYCGLWSGLLCKRSDMSQEETLQDLPEFEDLSGKRLHYVRLAQAKFKRPVVTNSNFRIVKLPDDITPETSTDTSSTRHNTMKDVISSNGKINLEKDWKGSLDDLVVSNESTASSLLFSREWFKKTLWKDRQPEKS